MEGLSHGGTLLWGIRGGDGRGTRQALTTESRPRGPVGPLPIRNSNHPLLLPVRRLAAIYLHTHAHNTNSRKMAPTEDIYKSTVTKSLGHVLVTGGSGGLASQIISMLVSRSAITSISSVDLRAPAEPVEGCNYHFGDLTDEESMTKLFTDIRPNVVIHTASPRYDSPKEIMYKVNVQGTENLVKIAQQTGVKAFVYTSSASVISDQQTDLINADEAYPLVTGAQQPEYYTHTKVLSCPSQVLQPNLIG